MNYAILNLAFLCVFAPLREIIICVLFVSFVPSWSSFFMILRVSAVVIITDI